MTGRPLVGRARELAELFAAFDRACAGRGSVQLLAGEPGIGKSRIAEEVANGAAPRNAIAVFGRCWEAGGAPPFWPWVEILRALLGPMDEAQRARVVGPGAPDVAQLVPELSPEPAPPQAPTAERFRLFDAITNVLVRASSARPLVLVLEDLHAADSPSLLLLAFASQRIAQHRILIIGTYRDLEARLSPEISELLRKIDRGGRTMHLARLGRSEVAELCANVAAELADRLYEATEGNPLFVDQVLRILEVRGGDARAFEIPDQIKDAIRERIDRVAPADLPIIEMGAAIGRSFALAIVARALKSTPDAVRPALSRAIALGILSESAPGQYAFTHVLIREVVHDAIAAERRAELHLRIADVLEELRAAKPELPLREIAHHLALAGDAAADRAIAALSRASDDAMKMLAFEEASALSEEALRILELAFPNDVERRYEILLALGRAQMLAGRLDRGKESCVAAASLGRQLGSAEKIARAALELGWRLMVGLTEPTLVQLLEEARAKLPEEDSPLRARVIGRLAAALQPAEDPQVPIDMALGAVEMAHRTGDRAALLWVLQWAGSALTHFAPVDQRMKIDAETVALAVELHDKVMELRGYARLLWDYVELGDFERADDCIRSYEDLAAELRQPHYLWQACLFRSMRAAMVGRFEDSEREQARAREIAGMIDDGGAIRHIAIHSCLVALLHGDRSLIRQHLKELEETLGRTRLIFDFCLVAAVREFDDPRPLKAALERFRRYRFDSDAGNIAALGEFAFVVGDRALAEEIDGYAAQHRGRFGHGGLMAFTCMGPVEGGLMAVAATLERWEQAEQDFQEAHRRAREVGAHPIVAHIERTYAEILLERGRAEDRARAASLASSAAAIAEGLGMHDFAKRTAAFAKEIGLPPAESTEAFGAGRYLVKRILGKGGQKTVYLVHDAALDRDCALAVIDELDREDKARLQNEGLALARMGTHPNVVTVFDIGEEAGRPYLVMELMAGGDLETLLGDGPLEVERTLRIARDLLRGLAAIHERGIIHRDLKPSNVWLDEQQNAKIGDFGLAVQADRVRLTVPGELHGTAEYASPEQLENREIDPRTDLYSLGCLLYQLCTGRTPFTGSIASVVQQHLFATPAPPSALNPKIPPALDRFVLHLMEKSPDARPADARAALAELALVEAPDELEDRLRDEKLASLADLVAGIAHEINTPLGALQANTDVLLRAVRMIEEALAEGGAADDPRIARALATLSRAKGVTPEATQRIARIVRDLKTFARLDQAEEELFDVAAGLDAALAMLKHELADRITVVRSYRELPPIRCKPAELNHAFFNIMKNSVQAIEDRGTITVTAAIEGETVVVRIGDTGRGIADEHLSRIFDPGFTTKGVGVGTGLGLSIAYRIVKAHGGTIEVESAVGQGSVFVIRLPVRVSASSAS